MEGGWQCHCNGTGSWDRQLLVEAQSCIVIPRGIARGGTVREVMAELMGKKDGVTKGMGGSMHM